MPFLQIIPYVADQFDEGVYVFDGGTFNAGEMLTSDPVAVYDLQDSFQFDSQSFFTATASNLGVYDWNDFQFDSRQMLDSRLIIFATGVNWQPNFTNEAVSPSIVIPETLNWQPSYSPIENDQTIFTEIVEGTVQNQIDQPNTRPLMIDSGSSVTRENIESFSIDTSAMPLTSRIAELTDVPGFEIQVSEAPLGNLDSEPVFGDLTLSNSTGSVTVIETEDSNSINMTSAQIIASLITESVEQGQSNTPQFTM